MRDRSCTHKRARVCVHVCGVCVCLYMWCPAQPFVLKRLRERVRVCFFACVCGVYVRACGVCVRSHVVCVCVCVCELQAAWRACVCVRVCKLPQKPLPQRVKVREM